MSLMYFDFTCDLRVCYFIAYFFTIGTLTICKVNDPFVAK